MPSKWPLAPMRRSLTIDKGLSIDGNGSTLDVSGSASASPSRRMWTGCTISNFTIVGDASTYSGITVNPGASNVSILNNDISGMALSNPGNSSPLSYGILCWGNADPINPPSNILIDGNEIHGVSGTAVSLGDNTESVTISNNHFHEHRTRCWSMALLGPQGSWLERPTTWPLPETTWRVWVTLPS